MILFGLKNCNCVCPRNYSSPDDGSQGHSPSIRNKIRSKYPRTYNIVTGIFLPLLILVCIALLCGHFLAVLESENELDSLNSAMDSYLTDRGGIRVATDMLENTYNSCIEKYAANNTGQILDRTELIDFVNTCKKGGISESYAIVEKIEGEAVESVLKNMRFNWNRCTDKSFQIPLKSNYSLHEYTQPVQSNVFFFKWFEVYNASFTINYNSTRMNLEDAYTNAVEDANSATKTICSVNSAGGAIFWFTIMTTIGYGNTAPVTRGGRALVYTLGFMSILAFTSCIATTAHICLSIADDFFKNFLKMKRLTKGWISVMLWFTFLWVWILVLAGVVALYTGGRYHNSIDHNFIWSFVDRMWWAFISITTVGFGDFFIEHETFLIRDMFYMPFLLLMGFVFLANFLLKLSEVIIKRFQDNVIIDNVSLSHLIQDDGEKASSIDNDEE